MTRLLAALLAAVWLLPAQTAIENAGRPMRIPFTCTAEDVDEAGLTCSPDQPCPVYLELSGAGATLARTIAIGNLHTADATLYSVLLATEDGGRTWTEAFARTRFTALEQIQFADFQNGWISGANVQGVPRDPFFLVTEDGGKSWRLRPVFDESRTGVMDRFWFDSKSSGEMLISTKLRYELYETRTGGESWSLRQFSRTPLRLKRELNPADAAVRVRADGKPHAFHVEKRQGEAWVALGSFLVDAGKCE